MKDKRGQEVSPLPVVIGIILLLAVAVVLIVGFSKGWQIFSFWIPSNNIQTIANQCNIACSTVNTYDFCTLKRTLSDPSQKGTGDGKADFDKNGELSTTCNLLSTTPKLMTLYSIPTCGAITCK